VHSSHYSAAKWVDHRKKKIIVFQEFDDLDQTSKFIKADGTVDNEKWSNWKEAHNVWTASWNVFLCQILAPYFAKRLTNKAKLKCVCEF
jgi:hypothetical protein